MSLDILAIAAHPDDIEQTCGGALIRMAEVGYRTGALDLTAGDMGTRGTPEQRMAEAEVAARHLRLHWRGNLRFPDARLENTLSARMTLAVKIRELRPRVVILPYWQGRHPEWLPMYNDEVPVIAIDGRKAFKYKVSMDDFLKKLAARA